VCPQEALRSVRRALAAAALEGVAIAVSDARKDNPHSAA